MNYRQTPLSACLLAMAALFSTGAWAQTAPSLGTASNFVVLGGAGVTCTASGVAGDVGSLVSVTGFPMPAPALCTLVGTVHALDATATTAFNLCAGKWRVSKHPTTTPGTPPARSCNKTAVLTEPKLQCTAPPMIAKTSPNTRSVPTTCGGVISE